MLRRTFAVVMAGVGVYYAALGVFTLLRLPAVTYRWIELTGDPDFRLDFPFFATCIGLGAVMVALLGVITAIRALRMARGDEVAWGALAIAAPFIHFPWIVYRAFGRSCACDVRFQMRRHLRFLRGGLGSRACAAGASRRPLMREGHFL